MRRQHLFKTCGVAIAFSSLFFVSCVDSDYDVSKNIDATMGLGSSDLALKFGNTEKIFLKDLLKVTGSNMLDTTTTHLYFLVKDGNISTTTTVNNADPVYIDDVNVKSQAATITTTATYPAGTSFTKESSTNSKLNFDIKNIDNAVKEVATVTPDKLVVTGSLSSNISGTIVTHGAIVITFPDFIYSNMLNSKHQYTLAANQNAFSLDVDSIVFPKTETFGEKPVNNTLSLSDNVSMNGTFTFMTTRALTLNQGTDIYSVLSLKFTPMQLLTVSGIIDKEVSPNIDPIQISNDLPDFLQDESVQLEINNPTLKIWTKNGTKWPFALLFNAYMSSVKNNQVLKSVTIPATGNVNIPTHKDQTYYFSQTATPFDTAAIPTTAEKFKVPTLGKLIEKIPDNIQIDMKNGRVSMNQSVLQHANFGKTYNFDMGYRMLIPLSFDANTTIVYKDSVDNLHKDLKKYQTSGIKFTADICNTVPLDLTVEVIPYDYNGNSLASEIKVTTETVKAASATTGTITTPISCVLTTSDPASIEKLDKLIFKISSTSTETNSLMSNQYIQVNNIRLVMTGQVIGNFN